MNSDSSSQNCHDSCRRQKPFRGEGFSAPRLGRRLLCRLSLTAFPRVLPALLPRMPPPLLLSPQPPVVVVRGAAMPNRVPCIAAGVIGDATIVAAAAAATAVSFLRVVGMFEGVGETLHMPALGRNQCTVGSRAYC